MYIFSIKNSKLNGSFARDPIPTVVTNGNPPDNLLAQAIATGNGFYEILMDGSLGPKQTQMPTTTYTPREIKAAQAFAILKTYARDFIIGNGTPTAAQRNTALDALIVVTVLDAALAE